MKRTDRDDFGRSTGHDEEEVAHGRDRGVATAEPGTGLMYEDGKFLEIIVEFEWGIGGDKVCKGRGEEGIFTIITMHIHA